VLIGVVVTVRANKSIGRWEQTLTEKEVLLSEIHHRVKNNMAVISGLLELESMQSRDPEQALKDSRDRIQSMAMIHEILYESDSFSEINLGQYLNKLTNYIADTYIHGQKDISLSIHFDEILVSINQAIPVGLIVNEMLADTIIHGFNGTADGQINIMLSAINGNISLSIKDNSNGDCEDLHYSSAESSGAMIVKTLVEQLDAELTLDNEGSSGFHLQFKKSHASGSGNANL
jgi:two-component sensor histidine kinase